MIYYVFIHIFQKYIYIYLLYIIFSIVLHVTLDNLFYIILDNVLQMILRCIVWYLVLYQMIGYELKIYYAILKFIIWYYIIVDHFKRNIILHKYLYTYIYDLKYIML
jgi:hypothetical protein